MQCGCVCIYGYESLCRRCPLIEVEQGQVKSKVKYQTLFSFHLLLKVTFYLHLVSQELKKSFE